MHLHDGATGEPPARAPDILLVRPFSNQLSNRSERTTLPRDSAVPRGHDDPPSPFSNGSASTPLLSGSQAALERALRNIEHLDDTLRVQVQVLGSEVLVILGGELCLETAPAVEALLTDLVDAGCRAVSVDLSDVTLLTAQGIGALVAARSRCRPHGVPVSLLNPQGIVASVLEVCRIPLGGT